MATRLCGVACSRGSPARTYLCSASAGPGQAVLQQCRGCVHRCHGNHLFRPLPEEAYDGSGRGGGRATAAGRGQGAGEAKRGGEWW